MQLNSQDLILARFYETSQMSSFICAISGVTAEEPVVSPSSGEIFERRLIVKYVEENGLDPVSKTDLKISELVPIKLNESTRASLRPLSTASIPLLLKTLQDEWDACMLNNFTLRQEVQTAREELTHALYQNDAACRVINRLSLELQAARSAMAKIPQHRVHAEAQNRAAMSETSARNADIEMAEDDLPGMNDEVTEKIANMGVELSNQRKQRGKKLPEGLADVDSIASYKQTSYQTALHSTGTPGITCLDLKGQLTLTGGVDKTLVLYNLESEEIESTFKGHRKPITACILHTDQKTVISSSSDSQIRIFSKGNESARHVVTVHNAPVSDISLHPTGDYVLSFSDDTYWSLIDLNMGRPIVKNRGDKEAQPFSCGQCHPDGLIFGTGTRDSMVTIWDLRMQENGEVRSICFSENGYYLASGGAEGEVKIWDLRKLANVRSFAVGDGNVPISAVRFDSSGAYLAAASDVVQVLQVKSWKVVNTFEEHTATPTDIRFGDKAKFIVTSSMDKSLRIYS
ncbi:Pre-mRNA-processing factor 19 [Aphelenchoides bicaudatus]|nr:Pre-mRNA-processing factor 19 [Aphelenchoides bicaudatus]